MSRTIFKFHNPNSRATLGAAAIEFGIAAPLLLILAVGTTEVGYSTYQAMQVQNAVEAGTLYVSKNGWDPQGITAAVLNASGVTGVAVSPPPAQFCGCPDNSGITTVICTSTCAGGDTPGQYVQINATLTRRSLIPNSGLSLPTAFSAQSIVRLN